MKAIVKKIHLWLKKSLDGCSFFLRKKSTPSDAQKHKEESSLLVDHDDTKETIIEIAMLECLNFKDQLKGKTIVLIDVSGSMNAPLSSRSATTRLDVACKIAVLVREICESVQFYSFSERMVLVKPRKGASLKNLIRTSQPNWGTNLTWAIAEANKQSGHRLIVVTDEELSEKVPAPKFDRCYMINVSPFKNKIYYNDKWVHIDGKSARLSVINYIRKHER
jgi:hypothetical protein